MKPDGVALRRGRFGLENAFDRFVTQIESESLIPDAVAVACAEATMWACVLDELWKRAEGTSYWDRRDADRDGYVMFGLRWARNHHDDRIDQILRNR